MERCSAPWKPQRNGTCSPRWAPLLSPFDIFFFLHALILLCAVPCRSRIYFEMPPTSSASNANCSHFI